MGYKSQYGKGCAQRVPKGGGRGGEEWERYLIQPTLTAEGKRKRRPAARGARLEAGAKAPRGWRGGVVLRVATIHTFKPNPAHSNHSNQPHLDSRAPHASHWTDQRQSRVRPELRRIQSRRRMGARTRTRTRTRTGQSQISRRFAESHAVGFRPSPCANLNLTSPHLTASNLLHFTSLHFTSLHFRFKPPARSWARPGKFSRAIVRLSASLSLSSTGLVNPYTASCAVQG
jgi:hypothetical protein